MATNYGVISNQNWTDFYEKLRAVGRYKINYNKYIEFLKDRYIEGILFGNLTPQSPKKQVTRYVHLHFWAHIDCVLTKGKNKYKNKHVVAAIRKIYTDCLNKILD